MRDLVTVLAAIALLLLAGDPCLCQDGPDSQDVQSKQQAILHSAGRLPVFNRPGRSLRQQLFASGQSELRVMGAGFIAGSVKADPFQEEDELRQASCPADVISFGTVMSRTSALSASETEVVTLYSFEVSEVYKGPPEISSKTLYVVRGGGSVTTSQGIITQTDVHVPEFSIGKSYVLFLAKLPGGDGFVSTEPDKSLTVEAGLPGLKSLPGVLSPSKFDSPSTFRTSLDSALAGCGTLPSGKETRLQAAFTVPAIRSRLPSPLRSAAISPVSGSA